MKKESIGQFLKFAVVGVLNTVVDFLVFQLLNLTLGWTYFAQVIGYSAGILNSYAATRSASRTHGPQAGCRHGSAAS